MICGLRLRTGLFEGSTGAFQRAEAGIAGSGSRLYNRIKILTNGQFSSCLGCKPGKVKSFSRWVKDISTLVLGTSETTC